jgi:hypothetical protein
MGTGIGEGRSPRLTQGKFKRAIMARAALSVGYVHGIEGLYAQGWLEANLVFITRALVMILYWKFYILTSC